MNDNSCTQCGTCCRKGGPALHQDDAALFGGRALRAEDLCAFRAGELVRDESCDAIVPLPEEIVKIAAPHGSRPDDWTCRFLTAKSLCSLHGKHPAECRALDCHNPKALLAMAGETRLDRKAICKLLDAPAWWPELIDTHEERCSYAALSRLAKNLNFERDARETFLETVEYDRVFRELVLEKQAAKPEELDFLFGRSLLRTVIMYGLDARAGADGRVTLVQTTKAALYPD